MVTNRSGTTLVGVPADQFPHSRRCIEDDEVTLNILARVAALPS